MAIGGSVAAIGRGKAPQWQFTSDGVVESSPAVVDGTVYVGSLDGHVYALDAATGTEIWSYNTTDNISTSVAVVNGTVYAGSVAGGVYALDADRGTQK